jgi:hypothetical protein
MVASVAVVLLPIIPGSLPSGACYNSEQARLNAFAAAMEAQLNGEAFYNYGDSKPDVADQGYPWLRTTDMRWYYFEGVWKSPVPSYSLYERRLFVGSLGDLQTYDGGDTNPASTESGPMWEVDTAFEGRSPMGPGAIASANPAKTLSVEENFGEGAHAQVISELAQHSHAPESTLADGFLGHAVSGAPATYNVSGGGDTISMGATATAGAGDAFNVTHPVRGAYVIKRTTRTFYVVP